MASNEQPLLALHNAEWRFDPRTPFLGPLSCDIRRGQMTAIIGPNGAGKTSLLRLLVGLTTPNRGSVELSGRPLHRYGLRERARRIAYLPQHPARPEDCTVEGLVRLGRFPHRTAALFESPEDQRVVAEAMGRMDVERFAHRTVASLSGGESQRAHLAAALAQQTDLLALDEPSAGLDLYHQLAIFEMLRAQTRQRALAVVAVVHDLNLASQFADQVVLLDRGRGAAVGAPDHVLDPDLLGPIYRVSFARVTTGQDARSEWLLGTQRLNGEDGP